MTNGPGKSDRPTVPGKSPNNARQPAAEGMEGKGLAKGNLLEQNASRTPSRKDAPSALERVRQAAKKDKQLRFTALLHHIYNPETLRVAYFSLKKEAAPGVDGETWRHYGEELERNLQNLSERLKRSEEHTSELQSRLHLVCRLLLEKKKYIKTYLQPFLKTPQPLPPAILGRMQSGDDRDDAPFVCS